MAEASQHATIVANRVGRVTGFSYKPDHPGTGVVATEVFIYDTSALVNVLDELHGELSATAEPDSNGSGGLR